MEVGRARAAKLAEAERELQGEKERGTRLWGEISEERKCAPPTMFAWNKHGSGC